MSHKRTRRASPPKFSDLWDYLAKTGRSQLSLSVELGISQGHLSQIMHRQREPRPALRAKIMRLTHVPVESLLRRAA